MNSAVTQPDVHEIRAELEGLQRQDSILQGMLDRLKKHQRKYAGEEILLSRKLNRPRPLFGRQETWLRELGSVRELDMDQEAKHITMVQWSCGLQSEPGELVDGKCECRDVQSMIDYCQDLEEELATVKKERDDRDYMPK